LLTHPTLDRLTELGLDGMAEGFRDLAAMRWPPEFGQGAKLIPPLGRTGTDGESDAQAVFG
jgi:hypothetical protein